MWIRGMELLAYPGATGRIGANKLIAAPLQSLVQFAILDRFQRPVPPRWSPKEVSTR